MRLKDISWEELNTYNREQLLNVALYEVPKARHNVQSIERNMGSSQAVRAINEMYPESLPYNSTIKQMTTNQIKSLVFDVRSFTRDKSSTLEGARSVINKILRSSGMTTEEMKKFREKMGGYRGINKVLDMLDEIRKFSPSLEFVPGSDGSKMESIFKAVGELGIKSSPYEISRRARELYETEQAKRENAFAFPFTV